MFFEAVSEYEVAVSTLGGLLLQTLISKVEVFLIGNRLRNLTWILKSLDPEFLSHMQCDGRIQIVALNTSCKVIKL